MSEKIKTAVMEVIKAHMDGEDKNTKAVLSDVMESVNELEILSQEPQCTEHPCLGTLCRYYKEPCDDAIGRDAVIDLIKRCYPTEEQTTGCLMIESINKLPSVTQKSETITEFADRCRECGAKYGKYRKEAKRWKNKWLKSQKSGKWIPVNERLPEYGKEVLTCSIGGFIEIQSLENSCIDGYWENQKGDWTDLDEVISWMPLPKPYEPQESEEV